MYLTINSKFKPFTYEDFAAPLREYGAAYKEMEEQYSDLASQTEAWKNIATQENSPRAYAIYKKFSDELKEASEDFSKGMNLRNRSQLMGLKARKESEIGAIKKASDAMNAANLYRDTVRAKDSTAVFVKDRYTSLDDFLDGQSADNSYISGSAIEASLLGKTYAAANSKFAELTKNGKVSANTAADMVMSGRAFDVDEIVQEELQNIGADKFDPESRAMLEAYVYSGVEKGFGSFIDKQTLTAQQREDIRLREAGIAAQRAATAENARQFNARMAKEGYNKNGTINPNSPYWALNGVAITQRSDGTYVMTKQGQNPITFDASKAVNTNGEVALLTSTDIESTSIKRFSQLGEGAKNKIISEFFRVGAEVGPNTEIRVINTKGGQVYYVPHHIQEENMSGNLAQPTPAAPGATSSGTFQFPIIQSQQ
jgi:hypothetical protein